MELQLLRFNQFFHKKTVERFPEEIKAIIEQIQEFSKTIQTRMEAIIKVKNFIVEPSEESTVDVANKVLHDFEKILPFIDLSISQEQKISTKIEKLIKFIKVEIEATKSPAYLKNLQGILLYLVNFEDKLHGYSQVIACFAESYYELRSVANKNDKNKLSEITMRLAHYLQLEREILGMTNNKTAIEFSKAIETLRNLGLLYTESHIEPHNLPVIAAKLRKLGEGIGKNLYGIKGICFETQSDEFKVLFVGGKNERHAELVQMMINGIPLGRLQNDQMVRAYLHSLDKEVITKLGGYELTYVMNENKLQVIQIALSSTILTVITERGELEAINIDEKTLQRMHYAILFSIDPSLTKSEAINGQINRKGSKIIIEDRFRL